jgi:DUF309 family protein family protein
VTLPLPLRNRLADLVLDALHDREARRGLEALAAVCADPRALDATAPPVTFPAELFDRGPEGWRIKSGYRQHAVPFAERATRAAHALADRPLAPVDPPLEIALDQAATLFAAGLYFEVHEVLEPHWMRAEGPPRQALQGLIQATVGYQHLANGNLDGARTLLHDGAARLLGQRLAGRDLDGFGREVARHARVLAAVDAEAARRFDWSRVPRFPGEG